MPLTWVVFGSKGWIGEMVLKLLQEREGDKVHVADCRADDEQRVMRTLLDFKPDRVVSLIGRTHGHGFSTIDYLEQKGKLVENVRDNLYGPMVLALACNKLGIHLTQMGTGCIFTTDEKDPARKFTEDDNPNFFGSAYSTVKGFTDRLLRQMHNVLNVRIRMPIVSYQHPRNFITKITSYEKICSIPNSMTVLPELLPVMIDMAVNEYSGTINLTNPGVISHNEMLEMYKEIVDPSFTWQNFTIEEQNKVLLSQRSNNHLDTKRLETLYPHVRPIHAAVRAVLEEMRRP